MAKKLPARIYVKREFDPNDDKTSYLVADETPDSMDNGDVVGIYELKENKTLKVTRTLG